MHNFSHLGRMDMGGTQQEDSSSQQQVIMQQIAQALQKGAKPEVVVKALVSKGLDTEQAQQIVGAVMQQLQGGVSQQGMQTGAEGTTVDDGPGDLWDALVSGAKTAYNTGKQYVNKAVDKVTHTDPINFIPFGSHLPANVKGFGRMVAANVGLGQGVPFLQKKDFSPEEKKAMYDAAKNAKRRTGKSSGEMKYSDYGEGYGDPWSNKLHLLTDPVKTAQTSIGRFIYNADKNDNVNVSDKYNFYGNDQNSLIGKFINRLDKRLDKNDPRRNINFNITGDEYESCLNDEQCGLKMGGLYQAADGVSIVDYLAGKGQGFSKAERAKLAAEKGIKNYDYSGEKNLELLRLLQQEDQGSPSAPVRKPVATGKAPVVTPASGMFGNYNPSHNSIAYNPNTNTQTVVKSAKSNSQPTSTMTEGQRTQSMIQAADAYTPAWKKKSKTLPGKGDAKKESKDKINPYNTKYGADYVDLMQAYGLDPFSKEGIAKAQELTKSNPKTRIVCTAAGCSEIAVDAAHAFGYDFNRGNAWDLGNKNKVVATNPVYANQIGKGILTDPTNYTAPKSMYTPGSIISLNRKNNKVPTASDINGMAITTGTANDSYDYANQKLYPGSRGNEHVGYMIDANTMLHGSGAGAGHPAYYVIDPNMANGVQLPGYGSYQPVETITPGEEPGMLDRLSNWLGFAEGGMYMGHDGRKHRAAGTGSYSGNQYFADGGMPVGAGDFYGGPVLQNYMKETSPMYNFGGYFPQGPRFADGGSYDNPGFRALPPAVQQNIMGNKMMYGGGMYAEGGQTMDGRHMGMINIFKKGGIYIKPSKRGTFTAAATKHGKSVQAFASQVLANKENYSPAMVKKANFAKNAAKWKHADGGIVVGQTYDASPELLQKLQAGGYKFEYVD